MRLIAILFCGCGATSGLGWMMVGANTMQTGDPLVGLTAALLGLFGLSASAILFFKVVK